VGVTADEQVGRRLARGIGGISRVGRIFGERRVVRAETSVDFVGRDVVEPANTARPILRPPPRPPAPGRRASTRSGPATPRARRPPPPPARPPRRGALSRHGGAQPSTRTARFETRVSRVIKGVFTRFFTARGGVFYFARHGSALSWAKPQITMGAGELPNDIRRTADRGRQWRRPDGRWRELHRPSPDRRGRGQRHGARLLPRRDLRPGLPRRRVRPRGDRPDRDRPPADAGARPRPRRRAPPGRAIPAGAATAR